MPDHSGLYTPHGYQYGHVPPTCTHTCTWVHSHTTHPMHRPLMPTCTHRYPHTQPPNAHTGWPHTHTWIHMYTPHNADSCFPPLTTPYTLMHTFPVGYAHTQLWPHTQVTSPVILKALVGETSGEAVEGGRTSQPLCSSREEWPRECRPCAPRASEFLRETGKLNFYVKYPDF